jgi:hypothetical protein
MANSVNKGVRMAFTEYYVKGREKILNRVLQVDPNVILTSQKFSTKGISGDSSLAGDIKTSLNQIKSLAMTENGKVDYQKLVGDPLYQSFRELVEKLQNFDYRNLSTREEKLAFWINLYNALVIDAVIQEKIRDSVTETRLGILAFFQKAAYQVKGLRFSLTDIEHGVLRSNSGFPYFPAPHFGPSDPRHKAVVRPFDLRIHFALNCASNSCPPIGVYTPEKIQDQLDLAARNFINSDLVINSDLKTISISKIFQWYQDDFGGVPGIISLLMKYINDHDTKRWLTNNQQSIKIQFHPYDWGLNKISE